MNHITVPLLNRITPKNKMAAQKSVLFMFDDYIDPLARKILRRKRIEGVGASDQGDAIF